MQFLTYRKINKMNFLLYKYFLLIIIFLAIVTILFNLKLNIENFKDENKTNYLKLFERNQKEILNGNKKLRLIINVSPFEYGYCNRIYSMLSSLLIALLSDRALLIDWKHIDKYIEEPLYNAFNIKNYTHKYNVESLHEFSYEQAWKPNKTRAKLTINQLLKPHINIVKFDDFTAYFFELCLSYKFYDKLSSYGLVSKETLHNANKASKDFSLDESLKQDILFKVGYEVGGNLLRLFWKPKRFIKNMIDYYKDNHFKDYYIIGLQMRFYYLNKTQDVDVFIDCAFNLESAFKSKLNLNNNNEHIKVKWFLSSDSEEFIEEMKKKYPNKLITTNGTLKHVGYNTADGYERTILDFELLSLCDELIVTGGSTYGFVPAMKSLKLPYYVNGQQSMKKCIPFRFSHPSITNIGYSVF